MTEAIFPGDHDCPVCHEEFTEPKLLPCNHRVCKKCLLSWLQADGEGGCPLCRAPVHCEGGKDKAKDTDITSLVEDLPTDLAAMAIVESRKALSGSDVCRLCDVNVAATSFCLDCNVKLCNTCLKPHGKIPSTQDHVVEDLGKLTSQHVIATHRTPCYLHPRKPAELYCWHHHALVCVVCAMSKHRECGGRGMEGVDDVAKRERPALRDQTNRLRQLERDIDKLTAELEQEVHNGKTYFKTAKSDVDSTFDRLQKTLDKRRQEVVHMLQSKEDSFVKEREAEKTALDQQRSVVVSQVRILDQLLDSSPDSALVGMLHKLKIRLDALEKQPLQRTKKETFHSKVGFASQKLAAFERDIGGLGQLVTEGPPEEKIMWRTDEEAIWRLEYEEYPIFNDETKLQAEDDSSCAARPVSVQCHVMIIY